MKDGGHQGADLSIRRSGDPVRAAANGVVVLAGTGEDPRGFGVHVVIAHRADDGHVCYSVYAHLERGSLRVKTGSPVSAGQVIGRVGSTGRASSPHLHFEIRIPDDPAERWEKAEVVDPVAYVAARVPSCRSDSSWARSYRLWAESAGIPLAGVHPEDRVLQGEWWCALAAALALEDTTLADSPIAARERMLEAGIHLSAPAEDLANPAEWDDVLTDIENVPDDRWRLPSAPTSPEERKRLRSGRIPFVRDARESMRSAPPTRGDICLLLADCAGDPPKP